MKQPKIDFSNIDYSADSTILEIDHDIKDFIKISPDLLRSHKIFKKLSDVEAKHIGDDVFLEEIIEIDSEQFEEPAEKSSPQKAPKKSLLKRLFN